MTVPTLRFASRTHVGHVRKVNEDALLALPEEGLFVVADGMGGHEGGDFASGLIVDQVAAIPPGLSPLDRMHRLNGALHCAHEGIQAAAERRGAASMGATVIALLLEEGHFACLWAGDSRLYRLRDGRIELLSSDHSLVGAMVEAGQMSWDAADLHPQSNVVTRAVGIGAALALDKIRGDTAPGDRFLLCSDGLTKYAPFDVLARTLSDLPIEVVADRLVEIALDGGGADNVTVIVVDRA